MNLIGHLYGIIKGTKHLLTFKEHLLYLQGTLQVTFTESGKVQNIYSPLKNIYSTYNEPYRLPLWNQ